MIFQCPGSHLLLILVFLGLPFYLNPDSHLFDYNLSNTHKLLVPTKIINISRKMRPRPEPKPEELHRVHNDLQSQICGHYLRMFQKKKIQGQVHFKV